MGVDVSSVITEAKQRKSAIDSVTQEHKNVSERMQHDIDSKIAEAKALIDELSAKNIERLNKLDAELLGAESELKRLDAIIYILGGDK